MENQHRKIDGYRELSQADIDLMNRIKSFGPQLQELVAAVDQHIVNQREAAQNASIKARCRIDEQGRLDAASPEMWLENGKQGLQAGLMALTRAVAQPTFF